MREEYVAGHQQRIYRKKYQNIIQYFNDQLGGAQGLVLNKYP